MTDNLKVGDRVYYAINMKQIGRIIDVNEYGYTIKWEEAIVRDVYITGENKNNVVKCYINKRKVFVFR
jgi:hypothetical protein